MMTMMMIIMMMMMMMIIIIIIMTQILGCVDFLVCLSAYLSV